MNHMKRLLQTVAAAALLSAPVLASPAFADTYIGLLQTGVNGGALTTVASDPTFASFVGSYGTFSVNSITVTNLTDVLDSTALSVSTSTPGEIKIYVASTDNAPGGQSFLSSLTANILPTGWTANLSTWYDASNTQFALTTPLASQLFTTIGTATDTTSLATTANFAVTGIYDIVATGAGTALLTEHVATQIIEPSSLALLGAALLGFVGLRYRRRTSSVAA